MNKIYLIMTLVCVMMVSCGDGKKNDGHKCVDLSLSSGNSKHEGHEYVDLGLSVKWATCNVGANKPEEYGGYYVWGETTTKETYNSDNSLTYGLSKSELQSQGYIDSEGNLTLQYDAARANWGGNWRMPTKKELEELISKCTWTLIDDVCKIEGPNGNSIILPNAGYRAESWGSCREGQYGCYLSSTLRKSRKGYYSYELQFDGIIQYMHDNFREFGKSVRPVLE